MKYHLENSQYIEKKLKDVRGYFPTEQIMLICVQPPEMASETFETIIELNKLCFTMKATLLVAQSFAEAAQYISSVRMLYPMINKEQSSGLSA